MLIGNYKKLLVLFFAIVFVNQENILLGALHSHIFNTLYSFYSMEWIFAVLKEWW